MTTEILLTNDDGIDAVGIRALADALSRDYDVTVVAPASNQSGVGGARSWWDTTVEYTETDAGYAVEGTPADCVAVADVALGLDPDVVVSGCNHGPNIGAHILGSPARSAPRWRRRSSEHRRSRCRCTIAATFPFRRPSTTATSRSPARSSSTCSIAPRPG